MDQWAAAWFSRNIQAYFGFYADNFVPTGNQPRQAWMRERTARITEKPQISVKVTQPTFSRQGDEVAVRFTQHYEAVNVSMTNQKLLRLKTSGNRWLIVREASQPG